ncbi:hypothetical protein MANES_01G166000v8 [Manihot esculenta]|uniref:Uncharacterized protein n=1 Tax=Manihot esculenta TaxID=3983 RepID=A0ACB7IEU5_MANES|nr:hypothetical protein MANES_01G166000v8 [Manihot esculenta]
MQSLIRSNKALAETIGRITVHCLYHRSGCTWQGPLSECTYHCFGCAFGYYPVVCNWCGILIVHRQAQEHAQNCPCAVWDTTARGTSPVDDRNQAQTSQYYQTAASSLPGQGLNQKAYQAAQHQTAVQATVPTAELWYQQQQQYQQYDQRYPRYAYQQYYPYQQQAVPYYQQPQLYLQSEVPQPHIQPQSLLQTQWLYPPQAQVHTEARSQLHPQYPFPQPQHYSQGLPQTHAQHTAQPLPQPFTSQPNPPLNHHLQPQLQHSLALAVTGHISYPQPNPQQQMPLGGPQHPAQFYPQGGHQPQSHLVRMQGKFPQQPPLLHPSQSHGANQNPQKPGLLPSSGQVPSAPPAEQQPVHSHARQPGLPHQRPLMQSIQQQVHEQCVQQQPFSGPVPSSDQNQVLQQGAYIQQQQHVHSQIHAQGPSSSFQQPFSAYPLPQHDAVLPHGTHPYQAHSHGGKPMVPPAGVLTQPHSYSSASMQVTAMEVGAGQSGNAPSINNQDQLSSEQQSGPTSRQTCEGQGDHTIEKSSVTESTHKNVTSDASDLDVASSVGADAGEVKTVNSGNTLKPVDDDNKPMGDVKNISESLGAGNEEYLIKQVKKEPEETSGDQRDVFNIDHKRVEDSVSEDEEMKDGPLLNSPQLEEGEILEDHNM